MGDGLKGMKDAILATEGVERIELEPPRGALYGAGAGTANPGGLRINPDVVGFVKAFGATGKPVGQFTSSRSPANLPAFCPAIVAQFAKASVPGQAPGGTR
jgi:protease I